MAALNHFLNETSAVIIMLRLVTENRLKVPLMIREKRNHSEVDKLKWMDYKKRDAHQ